jgi:hypothetical protein
MSATIYVHASQLFIIIIIAAFPSLSPSFNIYCNYFLEIFVEKKNYLDYINALLK